MSEEKSLKGQEAEKPGGHPPVASMPLLPDAVAFGMFALIEQKRYGVKNEMYVHKVIGTLRSNGYVDVPVQGPATETNHEEIVDVVACVCCGVAEREILRYRLEDVKITGYR